MVLQEQRRPPASCSTSCSPLRVPRAGGVAWEYDFAFGGGRPPWVSGLAQGTGVQSMARVAKRLGRQDEVLPILKQALGIFRTNTPEGVRVPTSDGAEYALYSFAPDLHVINGFVQALIGLYDLAKYRRRRRRPGAVRRGRAGRAA